MLSEMFGKSSNFSIRDVKRLKIVRNERYFNTIIATSNHGNRFNSLITTDALSARETLNNEEDFGKPAKLCQWFPKIFYINENNIFLPNILFTCSHLQTSDK